jgi:hypothetical protein
VPHEQPVAGQRGVVAIALAVLHEEVLGAGRTVLPQSVDGSSGLDLIHRYGAVDGLVDHIDPALIELAPGGWMNRPIPAETPGTGGHQAPVADARR